MVTMILPEAIETMSRLEAISLLFLPFGVAAGFVIYLVGHSNHIVLVLLCLDFDLSGIRGASSGLYPMLM
jgi:hypothetical protein